MTALAIFGSIVFGAIGMGYIWSGRRRGKPMILFAGIGLAAISYLVFVNAPVFWGLGIALSVLPFVLRN